MYGVGIFFVHVPSTGNYVQVDDVNMPSELNCAGQRKLHVRSLSLTQLLLLLLPFAFFSGVFHSLRLY